MYSTAVMMVSTAVLSLAAPAADEEWFGERIPGSGARPGVPDCGMSAAKVFDAPIPGLRRIGTLAVPKSSDLPVSSNASIGFEGLDRGLFEPEPAYDMLAADGSALFVYYAAFDFSYSYTGKCYSARTDAAVSVPSGLAPARPVLVDMLRGGVYELPAPSMSGGEAVFSGLPLVDYPLVLADRSAVALADGR